MKHLKTYEKWYECSVGEIVVCVNNNSLDVRNENENPLQLGEEYKIEEIFISPDGTERLVVSKDGVKLDYDFYRWRFMPLLDYNVQKYNL